jgi:hypothetical protein
MDLAGAVTAYTSGVDALLSADVDRCSHQELVAALCAIETGSRRVPMAGYAIVARLDREADTRTLGAVSLCQLLRTRMRISKGEAMKRIARARQLIGRLTRQGERLAPEWEYTAAAHAGGDLGDEHVEVIRKFFAALPSRVDPTTRAQAERTLADVATEFDPAGLTTAAMHLLALLHPDGEAPAEEVARKVGLTLGPQQPDGTSRVSGYVSAKLRAFLEPILAKFAERDRCSGRDIGGDDAPAADEPTLGEEPTLFDHEPEPDAETQPEPEPADDAAAEDDPFDWQPVDADMPFPPLDPDDPSLPRPEPVFDHHGRTKAQFLHDAVEAAFDLLLRSQTLGTLNGLPTTVVVTITLAELMSGAGYAVTGGGSRLPMRDLIAAAARGAYHYLEVFDDHTGEILHFGRARRCATGAQKLALFGRDRGCTCPGCTVEFYRTQAHHAVADWKRDGRTDIDDLTLACHLGNQMIEDTDWTTRRRSDGRFEWLEPPDPNGVRKAHLNNLHHPEKLLAPEDDDPF